MAVEATILIPTHDHGPLIRHALESALGQTVHDVEVFVVGDGTVACIPVDMRSATHRGLMKARHRRTCLTTALRCRR